MSSEERRFPNRPPRPPPSRAIAIPSDDSDDEPELSVPNENEADWSAASPGAGSYVNRNESWRPVPPPMLASSLETNSRFRPRFTTKDSFDEQFLQSTPETPTDTPRRNSSYGSIDEDGNLILDVESSRDEGGPSLALLQIQRREAQARKRRPPNRAEVKVRPPSIKEKITKMMVHFRLLQDAPRELWLIYALKFLSSYAYFSLSIILTLFLTEEFGMSDTAAGWAYGAYGVMSTFFGLICGWFIDYLGVRASLLTGAVLGAFARFFMAVTLSGKSAIFMLYTFLPFAECLGIPIMTIGIKRYTNARNRTLAFSLFYSMMNVAALCAGPAVDVARSFFGDGITIEVYPLGLIKLTGLRLVIASSAIATAAMCVVVAVGIREIEVDESGNVQDFTPNRTSPMSQAFGVLREPAFWKLTVFTLLLVGVRLVFRHLDATMPKYLVRRFGPTAPFGLVYAINPFLIVFLVPIIGLMTRNVPSFPMIVTGSFISALSPFWITLQESYLMVVLFMVTLSIGEAIYSPRVYEYTMQVSARGSEGLYSSLSSAPLFSVKLLVGGMSGWLLTSFMPADGPHHGKVLWSIIGISSLTSPILMWLLQDYISGESQNEEETRSDYSSIKGSMEDTKNELFINGSGSKFASLGTSISQSTQMQPILSDNDNDDMPQEPTSSLGKSPLSLPPISSQDVVGPSYQGPSSLRDQSMQDR